MKIKPLLIRAADAVCRWVARAVLKACDAATLVVTITKHVRVMTKGAPVLRIRKATCRPEEAFKAGQMALF